MVITIDTFDYLSAIRDVLIREQKAVDQFVEGGEQAIKAWNYLYGKVDSTPWGTYMITPTKPVTVGGKIDPRELSMVIRYLIMEIRQ